MRAGKLLGIDYVLEYNIFNSGAHACVVCFHGFGQTAEMFNQLAKAHPNYKFLAINLFFHGESTMKASLLTPERWEQIFKQLIQNESIDTFDVAGYSLGGRFALVTYQLFHKRIRKLTLVAPDGLVPNRWFRLATATQFGRFIFYIMMHSGVFTTILIRSAASAGLISHRLMDFSLTQIKNGKARKLLYQCWTVFRLMVLLPHDLSNLCKEPGRVLVVLGKMDPMIKASRITDGLKSNKNIKILVLRSSHVQLGSADFLSLS